MKAKKAAAIMLCAALGASMVTGVSVSAKDKDELVLYTWDGMVPQEVLDDFEKETGTKVVYSNFDTDETMLERQRGDHRKLPCNCRNHTAFHG